MFFFCVFSAHFLLECLGRARSSKRQQSATYRASPNHMPTRDLPSAPVVATAAGKASNTSKAADTHRVLTQGRTPGAQRFRRCLGRCLGGSEAARSGSVVRRCAARLQGLGLAGVRQ